jgi:hypothetical protein
MPITYFKYDNGYTVPMNRKELILEGKDAINFENAFTRKLSADEMKEIENAEALYKKHCML